MRLRRTFGIIIAALVAVTMLPVGEAMAGVKKRAVPNLDRDAGKWSQGAKRRVVSIPVTLHMATEEGSALVSSRRVRRWVLRANRALAPYGLEVHVAGVRYMPAGFGKVTRWQQRRRLASYAPSDGTIHAFVIEELDRPRRRRRRVRGLHWRYRGVSRKLRSREYVVVTGGAPMTTFAHELGHLFGLRHSASSDNIMCSCRQGQVAFTTVQGNQMRRGASAFLSRQRQSAPGRRGVADRR